MRVYYCSQFAPLVIFFLLFLAVVKNTKIPHFVRFNCMQSVMIDIIVMLFTIIRSYFPSELRWTAVLTVRLCHPRKALETLWTVRSVSGVGMSSCMIGGACALALRRSPALSPCTLSQKEFRQSSFIGAPT